jgi:hypothetical protein
MLNCSNHYCRHCGRHHGHWTAPDDDKLVCNGRCTERGRRLSDAALKEAKDGHP